jgi:hypothetical protein
VAARTRIVDFLNRATFVLLTRLSILTIGTLPAPHMTACAPLP